MAALRACEALMPQGMKLRITSIAELPLFNQDVFDAASRSPRSACAPKSRRPTAC